MESNRYWKRIEDVIEDDSFGDGRVLSLINLCSL